MLFKVEGPPISVEVYVDGRARVKTSDPATIRELALLKLLKKGIKSGEIKNIAPGHYDFNFTKTTRFRTEAKLSPHE